MDALCSKVGATRNRKKERKIIRDKAKKAEVL
jgi:hypothetical protein